MPLPLSVLRVFKAMPIVFRLPFQQSIPEQSVLVQPGRQEQTHFSLFKLPPFLHRRGHSEKRKQQQQIKDI